MDASGMRATTTIECHGTGASTSRAASTGSEGEGRLVRALDLDDELEDSALDSLAGADYADATPEQLEQLDGALAAVREVVGNDGTLSDAEIKANLWESYYDIDGTVTWALGATLLPCRSRS